MSKGWCSECPFTRLTLRTSHGNAVPPIPMEKHFLPYDPYAGGIGHEWYWIPEKPIPQQPSTSHNLRLGKNGELVHI